MNDQRSNDSGTGDGGDLGNLPLEIPPPPELEKRVIGTLTRKGLVGAAAGHGPRLAVRLRPAAGLAAAAVLVASSFIAGRLTAPRSALDDGARSPSLYALLLYEGGSYDAPVGSEVSSRYSEYSRWIADLRERDQFVTGEELGPEGWVVDPRTGPGVVQPWSVGATEGPVGGFFMILADDPAEAVAVASSLPHVRHGGSVVVRPVLATDTPPDGAAGPG